MLHPEINFDGLVGPTHGFGGLSFGNLASTQNKAATSNPRAAVLQGIEKMKLVASLGVPQGVLPPHDRPNVALLRRLGFSGSDSRVLRNAWKADPGLLVVASSASSMWAANAATICPSADSTDGKLHITPANLAYQFHRSRETPTTTRILKKIFNSPDHFTVHEPLPSHTSIGDEGAANHVRLGTEGPGYQIFVCGDSANNAETTALPARQRKRASLAVIRLNHVAPDRCIILRQNPAAIDAGAFHNDVLCVGSADVLLSHATAFRRPAAELLAEQSPWLTFLEVPDSELSIDDAIATYLFNSQLVPTANPDGTLTGDLAMIAPIEVRNHPAALAAAQRLTSSSTRLKHLHFVDLNQSMRNGGGPACLRLRIPITPTELDQLHPGTRLTPDLADDLTAWANTHYRTELRPDDLADPKLLTESRTALDQLTQLLDLGSIYDFQKL